VIHLPLIPAKAGIQRWVPAFAGTSGAGEEEKKRGGLVKKLGLKVE
jgi:hypothetical protein